MCILVGEASIYNEIAACSQAHTKTNNQSIDFTLNKKKMFIRLQIHLCILQKQLTFCCCCLGRTLIYVAR